MDSESSLFLLLFFINSLQHCFCSTLVARFCYLHFNYAHLCTIILVYFCTTIIFLLLIFKRFVLFYLTYFNQILKIIPYLDNNKMIMQIRNKNTFNCILPFSYCPFMLVIIYIKPTISKIILPINFLTYQMMIPDWCGIYFIFYKCLYYIKNTILSV